VRVATQCAPASCTPDAGAQLQPIPYACGAKRTLHPVAVGAMNIHDVRDRQTSDRRQTSSDAHHCLMPPTHTGGV